MKTKLSYFIMILLGTFTLGFSQQYRGTISDFPSLKGPYLGQVQPGPEGEIFASRVLVKAKQAHSTIIFNKEGTNAYWCHNGMWFSKIVDGEWKAPKLLPFSRKEFSDDAPFLSPDGKNLFFTSKRGMKKSNTLKKENIWVVDVKTNGWGKPRLLPSIVNDMFQHWQFSVDSQGTIYFGYRKNRAGDKDLYFSKYVNGQYNNPVKLCHEINTSDHDTNPYISPQGDYLIFTRIKNERLKDGRQDVSLCISFKLNNDNWSQALDLREIIKFKYQANCPFVSQDGTYLFYLDLYNGKYQRFWVKASFIKDLKFRIQPLKDNHRKS